MPGCCHLANRCSQCQKSMCHLAQWGEKHDNAQMLLFPVSCPIKLPKECGFSTAHPRWQCFCWMCVQLGAISSACRSRSNPLLLLYAWCDIVFVARRARTGLKTSLICNVHLFCQWWGPTSSESATYQVTDALYAQLLPVMKVLLCVPKYLAGVFKPTFCCLMQTRLSHSGEGFPNSF